MLIIIYGRMQRIFQAVQMGDFVGIVMFFQCLKPNYNI